MNTSVLVVDDDADLRALITMSLTEAGHQVIQAVDGPTALEAYHQHQPNLIVLDVGLGAMDGLEVCRRIRTFGEVPIIFLTSRDHEVDQLLGLAVGGDDYITKPFSPRILAARVAVILRRSGGGRAERSVAQIGRLRLDVAQHTCEYGGRDLHLTRTEFDILSCLMDNPSRVVTRDALVAAVWGPWFGDDHVLEPHISRLRTKVRNAGGPDVPKAVRGVGYKLGVIS